MWLISCMRMGLCCYMNLQLIIISYLENIIAWADRKQLHGCTSHMQTFACDACYMGILLQQVLEIQKRHFYCIDRPYHATN